MTYSIYRWTVQNGKQILGQDIHLGYPIFHNLDEAPGWYKFTTEEDADEFWNGEGGFEDGNYFVAESPQ